MSPSRSARPLDDRRRVVAVTGASAGVGRATAKEFAESGADAALLARDETGLKDAAAEVEQIGGRALAIRLDVSDAAAVDDAAARIEEEIGLIDVWINNAMASVFAPFDEIEADEYQRLTEVTYLGVVNGTRAALRRMKSRDRGTIVQVGSALAYRSIPLQSGYCGAKHAIRGFTESLRCELLHDNSRVHVTMVQLPALNTPQFNWTVARLPHKPQPVPPIYQPEVAARAIVWAADRRRREVWVGGSTVATIFANRIIPALLDRYLARTGFDSQQTDEPLDPNRPTNLWKPVTGLHATRGDFDDSARDRSLQLRVSENRRLVAVAGAAGAALFGVLRRR